MARKSWIRIGIAGSLVLAATSGWAVELKISTLAPEGSVWMQAMREGAAEVAERTEGRVKLRFYPGGSMGNESAVLRKIRVGQLHGGAFTVGTLSDVYPDIVVYALPVMFRSYDEADHVRQRMDSKLAAGLEKSGFTSFGFIEGGFAFLLSSRPARSFDDLKGLKAWVPEGDSFSADLLAEAGMKAIPLPMADVLTGLQTGLIDTVAGPPVGIVALQWFTKVKYLAELPLIYTCGTIVLGNRSLEQVQEGDRAVLREVLGRVSAALDRRNREDNQQARTALAKQGIQFVAMSAESERRWHEIAAAARKRSVEKGMLNAAIVAEAETLAAEARGGGTE